MFCLYLTQWCRPWPWPTHRFAPITIDPLTLKVKLFSLTSLWRTSLQARQYVKPDKLGRGQHTLNIFNILNSITAKGTELLSCYIIAANFKNQNVRGLIGQEGQLKTWQYIFPRHPRMAKPKHLISPSFQAQMTITRMTCHVASPSDQRVPQDPNICNDINTALEQRL